ncbi:MAG TPA: hypothetical protein ENO30_02115 [Thermodesulfobium narugense]|nr:hypothetical protein [Thermodesulfobium narugense]
MRKIAVTLIIIAILFGFVGFKIYQSKGKNAYYSIILAYNPKESSYIIDAYKSVLEELKVPYLLESTYDLSSENGKEFVKIHKAIIFMDGVNKYLPEEIIPFLKDYIRNGGSVFASFDIGVKTIDGVYKDKGTLSSILGVNNINFGKYKEKSFTEGNLIIKSQESAKFLNIPPYKLENGKFISGYMYGKLTYQCPTVEKDGINDSEILAYIQTNDGKLLPSITLRKLGGYVMYVSIPLGYLKAYSDDFPLRTFISFFLFKIVKAPHILGTPYGIPGLIVNLHIDSNIDYKSIPYLEEKGFLNKEIEYSIHICAGDFRDYPQDNLGFDACGKGRDLVIKLSKYGVIGDHGGFAHNYFSSLLNQNLLTRDEIKNFIDKNTQCLESIVKYKIREYSAPNGVHPRVVTSILEEEGFNSYYYTGDNSSVPNRTFLAGSMVSKQVIAFPITSYKEYASLYEMYKGRVPETEVENFLKDLVNYAIQTKTIRLFYSHPYDFPLYENALLSFTKYAISLSKSKEIQIKPMSYFADFLLNLFNAKFEINVGKNLIYLSGNSLKGFVVALPKEFIIKGVISGVKIENDEDYTYIKVLDSYKSQKLVIPFEFKN